MGEHKLQPSNVQQRTTNQLDFNDLLNMRLALEQIKEPSNNIRESIIHLDKQIVIFIRHINAQHGA